MDKKLMWEVIYANGAKRWFWSKEEAVAEAALYGIGIRAPLYNSN